MEYCRSAINFECSRAIAPSLHFYFCCIIKIAGSFGNKTFAPLCIQKLNEIGIILIADNMKIAEPNMPERLYSLDALRGFDMFWIMGAEEIFHSLAKSTGSPFWEAVSNQFTHPRWNGFHIYDLIFPLFLFMAGVSTPYSIGQALEKGKSRRQLMMRIIKRGLILVLLGIVYNNGLELRPFSDIRFSSVLGRIGIAYMFANIIFLYSRVAAQVIWFAGLLIGYWLILKFTSAPGFAHGD